MRLAPITAAVALACVAGLFAFNPPAVAQDSGGLDGVKKASLVLANGERQEGKVRFVTIGGETFVHVTRKDRSTRYVNLRHVVTIIPKK